MKNSIKISQLDEQKPEIFIPEGFERKLIKDSNGDIFEKFSNEKYDVRILAKLVMNGDWWVPEVYVTVALKDSNKALVVHSAFMSKRDMQEIGLTKENRKEKFTQYVIFHKDKFRRNIISYVKEAEKEIKEKEKFQTQEGLSVVNPFEILKEFINNPSQTHVESLLNDIKDKGYIRPALRGSMKGLLIPDMKAINRVVLDRSNLFKTPLAISAVISKNVAYKINPTGFGFGISFEQNWWSDEMAKLMNLSPEKKKDFVRKTFAAIDYYVEMIYKFIKESNKKLLEEKQVPSTNEDKLELKDPNIIDASIKLSLRES